MNFFQQLEQFQSALRDIAPILWDYHSMLKQRGFTDEQAFQLTVNLQNSMFRTPKE